MWRLKIEKTSQSCLVTALAFSWVEGYKRKLMATCREPATNGSPGTGQYTSCPPMSHSLTPVWPVTMCTWASGVEQWQVFRNRTQQHALR